MEQERAARTKNAAKQKHEGNREPDNFNISCWSLDELETALERGLLGACTPKNLLNGAIVPDFIKRNLEENNGML